MKKWVRVVGNAIITGMIVFFSSMTIDFPPQASNVWAAFIGATLTALIGCQVLFKDDSGGLKRPPIMGLIL